jgi:hypothetical protein
MNALVVVTFCAIAVGVVVGRLDAMALARSQSSEPLWGVVLLVLAGAAAAIPAAAFGKSFARVAVVAILALAIEVTSAVLAQGCQGEGGCAQAIVESLLVPLVFIYVGVSLPCSALFWWLRGRRENRRSSGP